MAIFPKRSLLYGLTLGLMVVVAIMFLPERAPLAPVRTGEALIGGPFTLTNRAGREVSDQDFAGRFMLIYFGYTFCPDVCPLDLLKITMALDMLEADGVDLSPLQPIFVTIDPARDRPEIIDAFLENFHPDFVGLTGSDQDIAAIAEAYKVGYGREPNPDGPESEYLMFHSSTIYLMGPDGKYFSHFSSTETPTAIAKALAGIIG